MPSLKTKLYNCALRVDQAKQRLKEAQDYFDMLYYDMFYLTGEELDEDDPDCKAPGTDLTAPGVAQTATY